MRSPDFESDGVQLYLGDCLDLLREMPDKSVDAVITDPPYGIGINKSQRLSVTRGFGGDTWDEERVADFVPLLPSAKTIIWGGNYYADVLPAARGWLIWDKLNDGRDFGEAELAWTNIDKVIRRYRKFPVNMDGGKVHPTQKPIELMRWCMEYADVLAGDTILDPFMGSGTTGVACVQTGRKFIGIEIDAGCFEIAKRRIREAQKQIRMPI